MNNQAKHSQHYEEGGSLNQAKPTRHEEGSSWASTPETRAQEGISLDAHADLPVIESQPAPYTGWDSPTPVVAATATAIPSYEPWADTYYDTYQHHQYDDYYLIDDYYLQDDYYYHDDYYPHLYDTYQQPSYPDYYRDSPIYDSSWGHSHSEAAPFLSASSFVTAASFATDHVRPEEDGRTRANDYVATPEAAFAAGAAEHLYAKHSAESVVQTPSHDMSAYGAASPNSTFEPSFLPAAYEPAVPLYASPAENQFQSHSLVGNQLGSSPVATSPDNTNRLIVNQTSGESILSAPTEGQVLAASQAAENLNWMESSPFWAVEVGASQILIQDRGPDASDGRFTWAIADSNTDAVLKGSSATVEEAKTSAILQASVHGYVSQEDLNSTHAAISSSLPARDSASEGPGNLGGLLAEPDDKNFVADGFLLTSDHTPDAPDVRESLSVNSTAEAALLQANTPTPDESRSQPENKPTKAGSVAGAATLGVLGFAGHAAASATKATIGAAGLLIDRSLREDEDLARVTIASDVVRDAVTNVKKHTPSRGKTSLVDKLLISDHLPEKQVKAKQIDVREKPEAANAKELFSKMKGEGALEDDDKVLLKENKEDVPKEKKPVTKRERDLAKKKSEKLLAKRDKGVSPKAVSVVKEGGKLGIKGALFAGGLATASAKKVISSKNEEVATAVSMVNKSKKTVRGIQKLAGLPMRIYHGAKFLIAAAINAAKAIWHGVVALATAGSGVWVPVAFILFLLFAVIVILLATATIINEEQEVSEITALIAELDEELTEEINDMGAVPILYADANDTYRMENEDGRSLTINADARDGDSDLKEVTASSVTVQTNAEAVAAYIDAKYSGDWQVGAASWKVTVDAFGKTWNIIEWDNMPEWARKALNATDQTAFHVLLQEALKYYVDDVLGLDDLKLSNEIAGEIASEMTRLIYDEQIQGINENVIIEVVKKTVKKYRSDLDITDDEAKMVYYHMNEIITELMGDYEPVALVYDEVVELHKTLNFWSEEYEEFEDSGGSMGSGGAATPGGASGLYNKYGYPNTFGYDRVELANWDGYNEVSVYGISEAGTTSRTADGTTITNDWSDTNMAIACEGLQNDLFAYWTAGYKAAAGVSADVPVKITLYNPETGMTVTAEVRDCGGWRGFNPNYAGMNADRQWDVLPAVWRALGGGTTAGTMNVYWKVDPSATIGGAAWVPDPITIEGYPWEEETDEQDDKIEITRPTYIAHGVQDLLNNDALLDETMNKDSYPSEAVYRSVKSLVIGKVQGVMKTLLTMENSEGQTYIDYLYIRRDLGDPFGEDKNGDPIQWVVTHRYNPGYEDFDHDEAYVEVKPLSDVKTVKAIMKGEVEEVKDDKVIIRTEIDSSNSAKVEYSDLTGIKVEEGDEIKKGKTIGKMSGDELRISYYEIKDAALQIETEKDWAYNASLFMKGFAGYQAPKEPTEYTGPSGGRSLEDCESIVDFAYSRLGCPYVWAATGPNTFDCSGLTQWCYARVGISIPRHSEAQYEAAAQAGNAHPINEAEMQPGDILWKMGHVGIYIGNNQYIHAPQPGDVVKVATGVDYFTHYLRYTK